MVVELILRLGHVDFVSFAELRRRRRPGSFSVAATSAQNHSQKSWPSRSFQFQNVSPLLSPDRGTLCNKRLHPTPPVNGAYNSPPNGMYTFIQANPCPLTLHQALNSLSRPLNLSPQSPAPCARTLMLALNTGRPRQLSLLRPICLGNIRLGRQNIFSPRAGQLADSMWSS